MRPLLRGAHQVVLVVELLDRHHRLHPLLAAHALEVVHERPALRHAPGLVDLVHLEPVAAAAVGEDQQVGVRVGHEQVLDEVLFLGPRADHALAAAPLRAVGGDLLALDVAGVRDRDHHVLLLDGVLVADLALLAHDLGAPVVAVLLLQAPDLVLDDAEHLLRAGEDRPQPLDQLDDLEVLLLDLRALEPGQARQPHLEDGVRLDLAELELAHEALARGVHVLRAADQGDDGVEVVEGDLEALEDVGALLGLGEVELGAAPHDLLPVAHVLVHQLAQVHHLRPVLHQGQHDRAEGHLQRGVHEELVEHDLGVGVLLELDHDAHAVAVGLVAQVADARDPPLAHQVGDLLEQARLADLERDLGRHQAHAPGAALLDLDPRAHLDEAAPGRVAVADALASRR